MSEEEHTTGKRGPQYDIDPKTLEQKSRDQTTKEGNKVSHPPRQIFKIKEYADQKRESQKPKFTLLQKTEENNEQKKESEPEKEKKKNQIESIFGKSLLGDKNGVGLFSTSNTGGSIFGSASGFSGIFSSNNKSGGLFGNKESTQQKKVFGSIFDFSNNGVPPQTKSSFLFDKVNKQDQQGSGDQEQLAKTQKLQTDKSKSTGQYVYQSTTTTLKTGLAKKFKKDSGDMIQNVEVAVFQDQKKENHYFTAKLQATKVSIVTGLLLKGKSGVRHLNNKTENLEVIIFVIKKATSQSEKPIVQKHAIRLQFQNPEISKQLFDTIQSIIKVQ